MKLDTTDALCGTAGALAEQDRLGGFDSLHLASFAEVARRAGPFDVQFSSFDDRLNQAARKFGAEAEARYMSAADAHKSRQTAAQRETGEMNDFSGVCDSIAFHRIDLSNQEVVMPLLPVGNVCIRRFARTFDGIIEGIDPVRYKCRAVATERMTTSVTFRISAKADCDDVGTLVPVTGLRAKGTTIRRADGFAHFAGRAQIIDATPDPDVVLFSGTLDLIARIGSHPALGEPCAPEEHVEGWFVGRARTASPR